jgi:hypothetical protein
MQASLEQAEKELYAWSPHHKPSWRGATAEVALPPVVEEEVVAELEMGTEMEPEPKKAGCTGHWQGCIFVRGLDEEC